MTTSTRRLVIAIAFALLGGLAFTAESSLLGMTVPSGGTDLARASAVRSAAVPARTDRSNPPNIVLILSDDQRADTLAAMPNVRELLAARGTTFENAFVSNSLCCPSRTTILTGNYSHLTGVYGNRAPYGGFRSFRDSSTLATWLDDAGFETALVGKYLNDYETSYVPPGWDDWVAFAGDPGYYNYRLNVNGDLRRFGRRPEHYSTTTLAGYATRFVRKAKRPFFLMFAPYAPHAPAVAPPTGPRRETVAAPLASPASRELDVSDKPDYIRALTPLSRRERRRTESFRRRQLRAIGGVDSAVGRIVHALEDTGQLDNTLVIFTSDNGVSWGEHRLGAERKLVPYEGAIHVPLVMRYDPLTRTPRTETRLTLNVDFAPTIAELAGAEIPRVEGRSLLPLLRGVATPAWRSDFLLEHLAREMNRSTHGSVPTYCGVRSTTHAYVLYQTGEEELYDLRTDPYELRNLARARDTAPTLAALRSRTRELCAPPPPGFDPAILCTIRGTAGHDEIDGRRAPDYICGAGGSDSIHAGAGNDVVVIATKEVGLRELKGGGRPGSSVVSGPGNDTIAALNGRSDRVHCGSGRDVVLADRFDRVDHDCEDVRRDLGIPLSRK